MSTINITMMLSVIQITDVIMIGRPIEYRVLFLLLINLTVIK